MTVHVAEAADIHENVETELLACREDARHLVVASAMTQPQVNNFAPSRLARRFNSFAKLPVGIMTMGVEQRGRQFDLHRIAVE